MSDPNPSGDTLPDNHSVPVVDLSVVVHILVLHVARQPQVFGGFIGLIGSPGALPHIAEE